MKLNEEQVFFQLQKYRNEIDSLDQEIVSLLLKRQKKVSHIADLKANNNIPILDKIRENEKLTKVIQNLSESDKKPVKKIFQEIMSFSKLHQGQPAKSQLQASVSIVGIGLMGGSLYKAIKNYHPLIDLKAIDKRQDIECPQADIKEILSSEYIFLCLPPSQIIKFIDDYGCVIPEECVVIDLASTKKEILGFVQSKKDCKFQFIPAHPIVGKETSGFESSEVDLYINKKIVICSDEDKVPPLLKSMLNGIGLKLEFMTATEHDEALAYMSHLPHLLALALVLSSEKYISAGIVPQSFKDLTRISGAPYKLWNDIFHTNIPQIKVAVEKFQTTLNELMKSIDNLQVYFEKTKRINEEFLNDNTYEKVPYRKPAA